MINFDLFEFACPPCMGSRWFVVACQLAGFGAGFDSRSNEPWEGPRKKLRLSLVREPSDWLIRFRRRCFDSGSLPIDPIFVEFVDLDFQSDERFIDSYLKHCPGSVGRVYSRYDSDIVNRVEDLPWSFVELGESLGVTPESFCRTLQLPRTDWRPLPDVPKWIRREVRWAEDYVVERYEY